GELGGRDAAVNAAVLEAIQADDPAVRLRAVRAAGQLRIDKSLPLLIERINHGGVEGELAAEAAAKLGTKGTHALQDVIHKVVPVVWDRILPPLPAEVRSAALQGLSKFLDSPGKDQRAKLFQCAADPQFRVAAPAMMLLDKLPVPDKQLDEWLALLDAPDLAA